MSYIKQIAEAVRDAVIEESLFQKPSKSDFDLDAIIASVPLPEPIYQIQNYNSGSWDDITKAEFASLAFIGCEKRKLYAEPISKTAPKLTDDRIAELAEKYLQRNWNVKGFARAIERELSLQAIADFGQLQTALERVAELERQFAEAQEDMQFIERCAVHHARKMKAEGALSLIQHYPAIRKITTSYADGVVPDTFDPYAKIAELAERGEAVNTRMLDALKDAKRFLDLAWRDVSMKDYSFEKLESTIHMVDLAIDSADQASPQVPDGWQLVPKEPTLDMYSAANAHYESNEYCGNGGIYKAMLAAAPEVKK